MKVLSCGAIPITTITMVIGEMHNDGRNVILTDREMRGEDRPFWTPVPKHVSKKLNVGDTITVVCVPVSGFSFGTETLAVKKFTGERTSEIIYDREDYSKHLLIKG